MPFKSESQRRYLWANDPEVAARWAKEYPGQKNLPKKVKPKKAKAAVKKAKKPKPKKKSKMTTKSKKRKGC